MSVTQLCDRCQCFGEICLLATQENICRKYRGRCYSNDLSAFLQRPPCSEAFFNCKLYEHSPIVLQRQKAQVSTRVAVLSHSLAAILSSV